MKTTVLDQFMPYLSEKTRVLNLFGQSECLCICTYQINDRCHTFHDSPLIPIGRPLPGCAVVLFDDQGQAITKPNIIGELFVAGEAYKKLAHTVNKCTN